MKPAAIIQMAANIQFAKIRDVTVVERESVHILLSLQIKSKTMGLTAYKYLLENQSAKVSKRISERVYLTLLKGLAHSI